ncbi:MAG: HAMP domain-containing protein [Gammaproteobacteria bacterium]|nr:HAMP domain-containing protein [Gammaproteobacteria bacterium]
MPRTLFSKLAITLGALLMGIGLLYILLSTSLSRHYQQVFLQNLNRDLARNLILDRNLVNGGRLDEAALRETFHHYMLVNPSIEIYLLDANGRIVSYSADPGDVKRRHVDLEPVREFLSGHGFPLLGDDPRSHDRRKVFSAAPLPSAGRAPGYLYVVLRGEEYDRIERLFQNDVLARLSGAAVLASLGVGLGVGLLLARALTRRLQRLSELMNRFCDSGFDDYMPIDERRGKADEIDRLGRHYNHMAERIRTQLEDLKRQDEVRRELVANVSHDLRTPLAALQGYIETLKIDAADLSSEIRVQYLDIALAHSRSLTRLVGELFELAKLDAREIHLRPEPFSVAELVQDVVLKFQLAAAERGVRLAMECGEPLPLVIADIGLIERVLENFIGNALRHTGQGGEIVLLLRRQDTNVEIGIRDDGDGIAPEDMPHIFSRFYRGGGQARSGYHAGLGLAIAQRIMHLHGEAIEVVSRPGQGALFRFRLSTWQADGDRLRHEDAVALSSAVSL